MTQRDKCETELNTIVRRVETLMVLKPKTRNNDILLFAEYLIKYYNYCWESDLGKLVNDTDIPSFESITRSRRIIQASNRCLAKDDVKEARAENEVAYANVFGK